METEQLADITNNPNHQSSPTKPQPRRKHRNPKRPLSMTSLERRFQNKLHFQLIWELTPICRKNSKSSGNFSRSLEGEDEIFTLAFNFFSQMVDKEAEVLAFIKQLDFQIKNNNESSNNSLDIKNMRSKLLLRDVPSAEGVLVATSMEQIHPLYKRISIASLDEMMSSSNNSIIESSSSVESVEVNFNSQYRISRRIIKLIYENPSAFLIIHSVCLLMKYVYRTGAKLTSENIVKLIAISAIISYKINYDQEINGINSYYGALMNFESKEISLLERRFLQDISFQTNVEKFQYYLVSERLMSAPPPKPSK